MARNAIARFSVQADGVEQARRELEGLTRQVDQLGETKVDGVRHELEQLGTAAGKVASSYKGLTEDQRQAYQQREQDAQQIERLKRSYKTLEGALEALDVQVQYGHRSAEEAARLQPQLAAAYSKTGAAARQAAADLQAGAAATKAAAAAQDTAHQSASRLRGVYQSLGYQVADVANQVGAGGNIWVALGMQVGQFLGVFGAVGAVAGAVVSIMGAVAGSITSAGKSADQSGTAYTNLAKAMELAAKASGEMKTASGANRAALEAERRSVVAAREEIVKKAEAELLAIQASAEATRNSADTGAPELGMAAGAYDEAATAQKKRISELRRELALLQGEYGIFNDGAREVTSSTGKAGEATKGYQDQIVKLRESLRGQIEELGVQVDTFDKSSAAKLRAKLQTEAMTAAGVADYKAVDAGTKALIDQAVARQEQIDRLEEQKKASEESGKEAEKARAEHERAIATAQDMVDRLKDETDQLGMTDRERAIFTRTLEAERQLRGKLSAGEMAEYLHLIKEEAGALYDATQARDRKKKADEEAVRTLEKYQQDVTRVATDIGKDISENLWDQITGQAKADGALTFFKNWAKRLAVELLNQNIVLPITAQIVGAAPGLFGIQAPAGAGGATGQGGIGGGLINTAMSKAGGWAMDKLGLSGGWDQLMATNLFAPAGSWAVSAPAAVTAATATPISGAISANAATGIAAGGNTAVANTLYAGAASGVPGAGVTVGGVMGAAGAGAFGGMLGGYIGTAAGSKAVGGVSGAALGAGSAYLASIMGISSLGGPIGLAIGAVIGAIMGAVGTQKPTVGPTVSSGINRASDGKSVSAGGFLTDNDGEIEAAQQLGQTIAGIVNVALMGGGSVTRDLGIGRTAKNGLYVSGSLPYREFGDDVAGLFRYALLDSGTLKDAGPATIQAIKASQAKDFEEAVKDIGLGAAIDAGTTALKELDKSLGGLSRSAKEATAQSLAPMLEEFERAKKLGLDGEYKSLALGQLNSYLDALKNPPNWSEFEQAMASASGQFQALREAAQKLDPAMAATINQIERETKARLARELNENLDYQIVEARGNGFINQINAALKAEQANARNLAAAGEPITRAQQLRAAELDRILKDLTADQLDFVTASFGADSDVGKLAQAVKQLGAASAQAANETAAAATALAAAAALAAYNSDVESRMHASVGNSRGSALLALDVRQGKERADATAAGYDTTRLRQVQLAERQEQAFKLAQQDLLEAYDRQIAAQQDYVETLTSGAVKLAQTARQFRQAYDALALNTNSPLSSFDRLAEARRQFETNYATLRSGSSSEADKEAARQSLLQLGPSLVELARGYYGSTDQSDYDRVRDVFREFGDTQALGVGTAEQQLATAQNALKELQRARNDAATMGQRQLAGLDALRSVMDQSYTIWQAALGPLRQLTSQTPARYGAPADVQAIWDGLNDTQRLAAVRQAGWTGAIDDSLNAWVAAGHQGAFETAIRAAAPRPIIEPPAPPQVETPVPEDRSVTASWLTWWADWWSRYESATAQGGTMGQGWLDQQYAALWNEKIDALANRMPAYPPLWQSVDAWARTKPGGTAQNVEEYARQRGIPGFAAGGVIPHLPGISTPGVDSVPLLGMPGEGVVSLRGMAVLGVDGLAELNAGRWPANDRRAGTVTAFRRPAAAGGDGADTRALLAELRRQNTLLERLIAVTEEGDADNAAATGTVAAILQRVGRPAGPVGQRRAAG